MGGAARYAAELRSYLTRTGRKDVQVIGTGRRVEPRWLMRREIAVPRFTRRVAINNVSFVAPGGERWTMLCNALHFLIESEVSQLSSEVRASARREAVVVRLSARRADVLVVPCRAMADRVSRILPGASSRIVVRPHPVSADSIRFCRVITPSCAPYCSRRTNKWRIGSPNCLAPSVHAAIPQSGYG